jgi:hypothetical protein
MRNIVEVHLAGDSTGEAQHSGRISDQQFLVSHVVPLASYIRLFSMYVQADTLEAYLLYTSILIVEWEGKCPALGLIF